MFFVSKKKAHDQQDQRNACVREIAEELKKEKWQVKANLHGFEKPAKMGEFRPDLEAKKDGCLSRICEVVTEEMFEGDRQRYLEVRNYCDEYDFRFYVVDKDGKRRRIDPEAFGKKQP